MTIKLIQDKEKMEIKKLRKQLYSFIIFIIAYHFLMMLYSFLINNGIIHFVLDYGYNVYDNMFYIDITEIQTNDPILIALFNIYNLIFIDFMTILFFINEIRWIKKIHFNA